MRSPPGAVLGAAVAFLVTLPVGPRAVAQQQMLFGDLQVFSQDFLASTDPSLSRAIGMSPASQLLVGQVQLDLNGRLSYPLGQLYAADSAWWWQGSDGGTLQNDLMQAYVSITPPRF